MKKSALYLLENFLVLFTGVILGAVLVSANVGNFWNQASDMGSLFGGLAAVLLIIVGWIKADEWRAQALFQSSLEQVHKIDLAIFESINQFLEHMNSFMNDWSTHMDPNEEEALITKELTDTQLEDLYMRLRSFGEKFSTSYAVTLANINFMKTNLERYVKLRPDCDKGYELVKKDIDSLLKLMTQAQNKAQNIVATGIGNEKLVYFSSESALLLYIEIENIRLIQKMLHEKIVDTIN